MNLFKNLYISTEEKNDPNFFKSYIKEDNWVEANELYGSRITDITGDKKFKKHFINHIEEYDIQLKRFILKTFKNLGIKSKDFRCDFFRTEPGGELPEHIDSQSFIAILIPMTENTGSLEIRDSEKVHSVIYQDMLALNTQNLHSVRPPTKQRLMFRIGVHDYRFEEMVSNLKKMGSL